MKTIVSVLALAVLAGCATSPEWKAVKYGDPKDSTQVVLKKQGDGQSEFIPTGAVRPRGSLNPKLH